MQLIKKKEFQAKPQAVIYEVNLTIDNDVIDEFDEWLQKHIDAMLAIPGFVSASTAVIENNDDNTKQRSVQFKLSNQEALDSYYENDAERLRAIAEEKFANKMTAQRRVLTPSQAALAEEVACANCGTQLEGRFCSSCGQREESRVPTFMAMLREVTNAMFGLESKLWKSIAALFFMPGHLTNAYLSGQRQKYTTPFRMYLLFSIVTFFLVALLGSQAISEININEASDSQNPTTQKPINKDETVASAADLTQEASDEEFQSEASDSEEVDNRTNDEKINDVIDKAEIGFGLFSKDVELRIKDGVKKSVADIQEDYKNGDTDVIVNKFIQPIPKALLIFLPFIALAFKILYLGRGKYYIEHLVYLLHNHAFLFALLIFTIAITQFVELYESLEYPVAILCNLILIYFSARFFIEKIKKNYPTHKFKLVFYVLLFTAVVFGIYNFTKSASLGSTVVLLWVFYAPYYVYRSMRVVYKSSRFVTVISYGVIFVAYLTLFMVMAVLYILFSGLTYS